MLVSHSSGFSIRMRYNVAQLLKENVGSTRRYPVEEAVEYPAEGWGAVQSKGMVSFLRTPRGVLVQARVEIEIQEECGRCLEPYRQPLGAEIEEEFFPRTDVNTGAPLEVPKDEDLFTIDEKHLLDLTEALRQAIWLARPLKPLCRPNCAGLCPSCGKNLNEGNCQCAPAPVDPRWAQLSDLFSEQRAG